MPEETEDRQKEEAFEKEQRDMDREVELRVQQAAEADAAVIASRLELERSRGGEHGLSMTKGLSVKDKMGGTGDISEMHMKTADEVAFKILGRTYIMRKKILILMTLNMVLVGSIAAVNYMIFRDAISIYSSINLIALFIFMFPIVMIKYGQYKRRKEIEELFPIFLRDFVESIRGGMTVPRALKSVSRNDYKSLSPYVRKMAVQLDWGVPVERVLVLFSNRIKSKIISRIISSVRESHRFGGSLADTLEALSNTAVEVERLREERRLYLHSQMITGYIIFFVFLAVIIALQTFLVPSMSSFDASTIISGAAPSVAAQAANAEQYKTIFRHLILIQGFFAGLAVGKMAEGAVVAGFKHSLFMMFIGSLVFALAA